MEAWLTATETPKAVPATPVRATGWGARCPTAHLGWSASPRVWCGQPAETLTEAQRLLDEGKPFHAHEVFEDAWKSADGPERGLWKGLAQLAVGLTHRARGNAKGAQTLLARGADAIEPYAAEPPYGVDVAGLVAWVRAGAEGSMRLS